MLAYCLFLISGKKRFNRNFMYSLKHFFYRLMSNTFKRFGPVLEPISQVIAQYFFP